MLAEKAKRANEQKLLEAIKVSLLPFLSPLPPTSSMTVCILHPPQSRGIHLDTHNHHGSSEADKEGLPLDMSLLSLEGPHPSGGRVHLNSEGQLVWPVLLLYPEYGQTDIIAAFNETQRLVCVMPIGNLWLKHSSPFSCIVRLVSKLGGSGCAFTDSQREAQQYQ